MPAPLKAGSRVYGDLYRMLAYVYILFSPSLRRYYVGSSHSVRRRLRQHWRGASVWTSRASDWTLIYKCKQDTFPEALAMEKSIKSRGIKRFLEDIKRSGERLPTFIESK